MKLAVLGAGFIGLNFIRHALNQGATLNVLDHKPCSVSIKGDVNWFVGDLSNEQLVQTVITGADAVFHFISSTVPGDELNIDSELQQNVFQTLQLLNLCVRAHVRRVVFISSASVYGLQAQLPIPETASTNPISAHGVHKLAIEKYLQLYNYLHGMYCKILRLSNPYGPGQKLDGRQGFVAIAIRRILSGEGIVIRGDGSIIRDFVYIDDVCDTLFHAGHVDSAEVVFNVGNGQGYSLNEVVGRLEQLLNRPIPITYVANRSIDIPESVLDVSLARGVLGMGAGTSLETGLAATLKFHGLL